MRIEVTTQELYDNLFASFKDTFWDDPNVNTDFFFPAAQAIARGHMDGIRQAFHDSLTPLMMGEKMEQLEKEGEKEIVVRTPQGEAIGILVDREINF